MSSHHEKQSRCLLFLLLPSICQSPKGQWRASVVSDTFFRRRKSRGLVTVWLTSSHLSALTNYHVNHMAFIFALLTSLGAYAIETKRHKKYGSSFHL